MNYSNLYLANTAGFSDSFSKAHPYHGFSIYVGGGWVGVGLG